MDTKHTTTDQATVDQNAWEQAATAHWHAANVTQDDDVDDANYENWVQACVAADHSHQKPKTPYGWYNKGLWDASDAKADYYDNWKTAKA